MSEHCAESPYRPPRPGPVRGCPVRAVVLPGSGSDEVFVRRFKREVAAAVHESGLTIREYLWQHHTMVDPVTGQNVAYNVPTYGTGSSTGVGYGVIAGALLSVFVVTNVTRLLLHHRGGFMYFDMSGIVLAVVGAALILLARLFDHARALQSELDEIF